MTKNIYIVKGWWSNISQKNVWNKNDIKKKKLKIKTVFYLILKDEKGYEMRSNFEGLQPPPMDDHTPQARTTITADENDGPSISYLHCTLQPGVIFENLMVH